MEDVIFKGHKNKLVVVFNGQKNFEQLRDSFYTKLDMSKSFFRGARKTCIEFEGYDLSDKEKLDLVDIFKDRTKLETFLDSGKRDEKQDNLSARFVNKVGEVKNQSTQTSSILHRNSLRGGQFIHYDGSVTVIGDVNPGAEIVCTGNIVVMGKIKGFVHAGCSGDKSCIISSLSMAPVQLRIANIVSCMPEDKVIKEPSYAYIDNDKLYISSLV